MSGLLDTKVEVPCPRCARRMRVRLADIQAQRLVTCPVGHRVQLREQGHGIRDADRAMRELERSLRRLKNLRLGR